MSFEIYFTSSESTLNPKVSNIYPMRGETKAALAKITFLESKQSKNYIPRKQTIQASE